MSPGVSTSNPVTLQFSLYYPYITESTYYDDRGEEDVVSAAVMGPIYDVLCRNGFYLMRSGMYDDRNTNDGSNAGTSVSGETSLCISFQPPINMMELDYGNPNITVLMQAPIVVEDRSWTGVGTQNHVYNENRHDDDTSVSWTVWMAHFYVTQIGKPMIDMAMMGSGGQDSKPTTTTTTELYHHESPIRFDPVEDEEGAELVDISIEDDLVNDVIQLVMQAIILDGSINDMVDGRIPGAKYSLVGREYTTWYPLGIFGEAKQQKEQQLEPDEGNDHGNSNHVIIGRNSYDDGDNGPYIMSTVATSLYDSNVMRNCGITLFVCTLLSLLLLINRANNRRLERENYHNKYHNHHERKKYLQHKQYDKVEQAQQSQQQEKKKNPEVVNKTRKTKKKKEISLATDQGVDRMLKRSNHRKITVRRADRCGDDNADRLDIKSTVIKSTVSNNDPYLEIL